MATKLFHRLSGTVQTTDTTATVILNVPIATSGTIVGAMCTIVAREASGGTPQCVIAGGSARNVSGTVTSIAFTSIVNSGGLGTPNPSAGVSGTNWQLKVTGLNGFTIDWMIEADIMLYTP